MRDISGLRVAWTGGTRGFGRLTVRRLAEAGASVALCARDGAAVDAALGELNAAGKGGRAVGRACDVRDFDQVLAFAELVRKELGGVDVLVNNAGTGRPGNVDEIPLDAAHEMLDTNLKGVFHAARAFLPLLRLSPGSLVINVGSVGGKRPGAGHTVYSASKSGVAGFSLALARELRPQGVRVCHLVPGGIETQGNPHPSLKPAHMADAFLGLLRLDPGVIPLEYELVPANEGF
jgi:NAD(P)-dependent dehydrogenase (short-subunit alcohol dehydrogenase family)